MAAGGRAFYMHILLDERSHTRGWVLYSVLKKGAKSEQACDSGGGGGGGEVSTSGIYFCTSAHTRFLYCTLLEKGAKIRLGARPRRFL
jgi:hypothetical protein